jgi:hypothetical protein
MTTCSHLYEIRKALTAGHWPHAAAPELRTHAEICNRCAQEILLTGHFQQARANAIADAQPGTASLLWWRAQLRRRNAALTRAGRPIAAAQVFALAVALIAMAALIATHWSGILALSAPAHIPSAQDAAASITAIGSDWGLTTLILAITLITTLGCVVLYLSTDRH